MRLHLSAVAFLLAAAASLAQGSASPTSAPQDAPSGQPEAFVDLASAEGLALVQGEWRYSDTRIVETEFPGPGADNQPTGSPEKTYDYEPHAGGADFDDSQWEIVAPARLAARRGHGRLGFNWYRLALTIPETIGGRPTLGKDLVFETTLDDAAEVWVDGELTRYLGQRGGSMVAGWNAANRLVVGRRVQPGQKIQLAIFGINGPLSSPPTNFIYVRTARLELHPGSSGPLAITPAEVNVSLVRKDPAFDAIVGPNPKIWKLAEGFAFTEGPIWVPEEKALLFSDPNRNTIYRYLPDRPGSRSSGRRAVTPARTSPSTDSPVPTASRSTRRAVSRSTSTAIAASFASTAGRRPCSRIATGVSGSTAPTTSSTAPTGRSTSPIRPSACPKFFDDPRKELTFSGVYAVSPGGPATAAHRRS